MTMSLCDKFVTCRLATSTPPASHASLFLLLDLGKANMIGMGVGALSRTSQSTST